MKFDIQEYIKNLEKQAANNDIGKMMASQIGVDLNQNSYLAITAMENVYVELENLTKNAEKNAQNLAKKQRKRALENLKTALELEFITEQQYYEKLKKYRDEHLKQGTDEWYKATTDIALYNKRLADDALEEAERAKEEQLKIIKELEAYTRNAVEAEAARQINIMNEIFGLEKKISEKLGSVGGEWFSSQKITIHGAGDNNRDIVYYKKTLDDFESEVRKIERYKDSVMKLDSLGDIPDKVFAEIAQMDFDDAMVAMDVLLSASDEMRRKFSDGFEFKEFFSDRVASEVNPILNKAALEELGIESAEAFNKGFFELDTSGKAEFLRILEESFENIPESYYVLGAEAGKLFGESFQQEFEAVMQSAQEKARLAVSGVSAELASLLEKTENTVNSSVSKVYNTSYNFNAAKETVREQLETAKNEALLKKLRGGD